MGRWEHRVQGTRWEGEQGGNRVGTGYGTGREQVGTCGSKVCKGEGMKRVWDKVPYC
jgi:hypothetical protein